MPTGKSARPGAEYSDKRFFVGMHHHGETEFATLCEALAEWRLRVQKPHRERLAAERCEAEPIEPGELATGHKLTAVFEHAQPTVLPPLHAVNCWSFTFANREREQ